jgi:PAS domain S-box-containing protein
MRRFAALVKSGYVILFPRGVRVWHFIVIPPLAMAVLLGLFQLLDNTSASLIPGPASHEVYLTFRTVAISLAMASIIAFLAVQYRTGYERAISSQNEALAATRDFLSGIIHGTADAIIVRDSAGRIMSWNPAAEAIFGWTAAELERRTAEVLVAPSGEAVVGLRRIDAALREGHTLRNIETEGFKKDGTAITLAMTVAPLYDTAGSPAGSTAIVRDVTALKQLERQLVESERLAAVGELAAVVAHEVRNPLAGIRGGCELLLEGYPPGDPRHDIGVEVIHQVDRLNRMVHDLLLFARPKAMDLLPTDLHALLDRVLNVLGDDPDNAGVEIVRDFEGDALIVPADGRQLEQVFVNLVLNAIQALQHKGTITVATREGNGRVAVSVRDSGPGISQDALPHIFNPFFTTRAQGTGLGLAIVKKIVAAHGGTIEASSPPGAGAQFTVTLAREA